MRCQHTNIFANILTLALGVRLRPNGNLELVAYAILKNLEYFRAARKYSRIGTSLTNLSIREFAQARDHEPAANQPVPS